MSAGRMWRISLLGGLRLEAGDEIVTRFRSQKIGHLLAYLALFPQRAHTREELTDLLWPDADGEAGRTNLRTALSSLRRQLEPPGTPAGTVLVAQGHGPVRLNGAAFTTDVAEFECVLRDAAPSETQLSDAVRLYRGPLLPGCYETWALAEQERLATLHRDALRSLAGRCAGRGDWGQATDWAHRAVAADPWDEAAHGDVIRFLMASGQATAAQRHFAELARILHAELGMEPSAETCALLTPEGERPLRKADVVLPAPCRNEENRKSTITAASCAEKKPGPLHLPLTLTRFFGREQEIAALTTALRDARLVTVTGPGGSGKTRLAIEAARAAHPYFEGGIWFAPLAEVRQPALFFDSLAATLGLPSTPGIGTQQQVKHALCRTAGPALLVLDNFEQIVETGASLVQSLLADVPNLCCLVTSRQRLMIDGEHDFPLLPLPAPRHAGTPERLLEFSSVQLFVCRAQSVRPDFQITPRNAAAVAALCERLEGIPLALELAAGWAQTLSPAQMLERTVRRFDLLVSRRRDIVPRHATLRATLEWSYRGLSPALKTFFAGLSVFRGGWTLDAATEVLEEPRAWEYLAELQERSLILPIAETGLTAAPRFQMLETLREFGDEQVEGSRAADLMRRHAAYYGSLAETSRAPLVGAQPQEWLERLEAEVDNFRAVLRIPGPDSETSALRLGAALMRFWEIRGYWREGLEHLSGLLDRTEACDYAACDACLGAATLARLLGEYEEAEAFCYRGLRGAEALGDTALPASFLTILGLLAQYQGQHKAAQRFHEDSLTISRRLGKRSACGASLHNLGRLAELQRDVPGAMRLYGDALALFRAEGDRMRESMCLSNLGNVYYQAGEYDAARQIYEQSLEMQQEMGHRAGVPISLFNLGCVRLREDDCRGAEEYFRQSLRLHWQQGNKRHICFVFEGLAAAAFREDKAMLAVLFLSVAEAMRSALHASLEWGEEMLNPPSARIKAQEAQYRAVWQRGQALTPEQAVSHVLKAASPDGTGKSLTPAAGSAV